MEFKDLIGKTIVEANQKKLVGYDDDGYLELKFSDGSKVTIVSYYGNYTGESQDEYPTRIYIDNIDPSYFESNCQEKQDLE